MTERIHQIFVISDGRGETARQVVKAAILQFDRLRYRVRVAAEVRDLLADEISPIILAAVDYYHPIYRSVSKLENLADQGIIGNISGWDEGRIHAAAWPICSRTSQVSATKRIPEIAGTNRSWTSVTWVN